MFILTGFADRAFGIGLNHKKSQRFFAGIFALHVPNFGCLGSGRLSLFKRTVVNHLAGSYLAGLGASPG